MRYPPKINEQSGCARIARKMFKWATMRKNTGESNEHHKEKCNFSRVLCCRKYKVDDRMTYTESSSGVSFKVKDEMLPVSKNRQRRG